MNRSKTKKQKRIARRNRKKQFIKRVAQRLLCRNHLYYTPTILPYGKIQWSCMYCGHKQTDDWDSSMTPSQAK